MYTRHKLYKKTNNYFNGFLPTKSREFHGMKLNIIKNNISQKSDFYENFLIEMYF